MAMVDLIELLLHGPAGARHLGVAVACLVPAAAAILASDEHRRR